MVHVAFGLESLRKLLANDDGATIVEYAMIAVLIGVVCFVVVAALGQTTSQSLSTAAASV
jgi:Flp pilus assembly pilin Flp